VLIVGKKLINLGQTWIMSYKFSGKKKQTNLLIIFLSNNIPLRFGVVFSRGLIERISL